MKNFRTAEQWRVGHLQREKALELPHYSQDLLFDLLGLELANPQRILVDQWSKKQLGFALGNCLLQGQPGFRSVEGGYIRGQNKGNLRRVIPDHLLA